MWSSTTKNNIARLQKVQNFVARIVTGARKYEHITPMLKELHWLPVAKQLEVRDILMAFKCIKGLAPPSLCNKFSTRSQVHTRNTRNKDKLHIPSFRSATGQRSFSYRAVQLWNDLPESLANIESFNVFKNAIKGRALDLTPLTLNRCNYAYFIFLNNMVMFYHFQMFILDFYCSY